jgi:hypothetical protein
MAAAAKNLTTVTLELGGKSPVLIDDDPDIDIDDTARKIVWGKFINAGQTCVAPDYVLIPESKLPKFVDSARKWIRVSYGTSDEEIKASPDYCKIINDRHHARITSLLEDAVRSGSQVLYGARGRPRKSDEVLMKSAEFIGWALGGIEREIAVTRQRLADLNAQAARLRARVGRPAAGGPSPVAAPSFDEPGVKTQHPRRKMSAEGRKRISEMMKKRWADYRKKKKVGPRG